MWPITWKPAPTLPVFPNSGKGWGVNSPIPVKEISNFGNYLPGGERLRRSDFQNLNLSQS